MVARRALVDMVGLAMVVVMIQVQVLALALAGSMEVGEEAMVVVLALLAGIILMQGRHLKLQCF